VKKFCVNIGKKRLMLGYFYKKKDNKLILCKITSLLLMVALACHFFMSSQATAKNKFEKNIPISINISSKWDYRQGNHRVVGFYKSNIIGTANLMEEKGEFIRYSSKNLTAFYELKEDHIDMSPDSPCFGKIVEKRDGMGSGNVKNFILDIFLGHTGRFTWVASQGRAPTPEELKIPKDVYQVMMEAEGKFTAKTKFDKGCEPVKPTSGIFPIGFTVGIAEITPWGSTCSYTWQGDIRYKDEKVILMVPSPAPLRAPQYQVSWTFGEVKPVVRIYREEKDITDKKFEDVIIGKKVKLKAKVFPEGCGTPQGKWEIGEKTDIVSGWYADASSATLKPFTDYDKPEIEFFWVGGEFGGKSEIVKYSGQVNGKDVSAKTTFHVFKPKIKSENIDRAKTITVGSYPEKGKEGGKLICQVYSGYVEATEGKPPKMVTPGVLVSHEIEMPPMPEQIQHLLQHVQLVKDDTLHHNSYRYIRTRNKNDQWCLDTEYPYDGRKPFRIDMDDTPGPELLKITKECHVQQQFQTYLMFIPSSNPEDENAIWVPLRLIKWEWAAGVKKGEDMPLFAPCDKKTYKPIYEAPPRVKGKVDTFVHPEWSCNADHKQDMIIEDIGEEGKDDENWKRLTAEREKRWRGK
jgi:hypothetical protein